MCTGCRAMRVISARTAARLLGNAPLGNDCVTRSPHAGSEGHRSPKKARVRHSLALALCLLSCSEPERTSFIAFERDFQGFRRWSGGAFEELPARGQTHYAGEQRYFIRGPERRGPEFPVGTLIVKQALLEARPEGQLFAMVKRGAGYNASGAQGWEWFELSERPNHSVAIKWRGVSAPTGEEYGGDPHGSCNTCHGEAKANDFVKSPALQLARR